ncbi:MAG TPA: hypothetical protein VGO58_15460 [Chitinophagaceae bacterium]|jgi:hypothetical protein|nr:hypothetical protein [Chitinophagaceae bacterium]
MTQEQVDKSCIVNPYVDLGGWEKEKWVIKCCTEPTTGTPGGCDCCYDAFTNVQKKTSLKLNEKLEKARQAAERYKFLNERRDMLKSWYEDLKKADELARTICGEFSLLDTQVEDAHQNSTYAIEAIRYLFCMIKDFFTQVDNLKTTFDNLWNCLATLNNPEVNRSGVYKSLQAYKEKLETVVKTRDELIRLIILAIRLSNQIEEELSDNYGIRRVFKYWRNRFNCCKKTEDTDPCKPEQEPDCKEPTSACVFVLPLVQFPILGSVYYKKIEKELLCHEKLSQTELTNLNTLNKEKAELVARTESLKKAIEETNPENRCK